ncbi:MAG: inositol monophosphatase [Oligoflexia bacterium]|nr:inositol monophosphatase [Oligoflexia bacterium]
MAKNLDVAKLNFFTQKLAKSTSKILLKYFRSQMQVKNKIKDKKNYGVVTKADILAEKYIIKEILKKYPQSEFIAEESVDPSKAWEGKKVLSRDNLLWVIDPLDGTTNFASGIGWFSISIGVLYKGKIISGVIYHPVLDEMFSAYEGNGSYLNYKKIHVSKNEKMKDAVLATGFYYMRSKKLHREIVRFEKVSNKVRDVRRFGSAALDIAYTSCGRYDGFFEFGLAPWDVAAGIIIAEEAGATISNYQNKKTNIYEKNIVISNGKIHNNLVKILK